MPSKSRKASKRQISTAAKDVPNDATDSDEEPIVKSRNRNNKTAAGAGKKDKNKNDDVNSKVDDSDDDDESSSISTKRQKRSSAAAAGNKIRRAAIEKEKSDDDGEDDDDDGDGEEEEPTANKMAATSKKTKIRDSKTKTSKRATAKKGPKKVEEIVSHKLAGKKTLFCVRWANTDDETWEAEADLQCPDLLEKYKKDVSIWKIDKYLVLTFFFLECSHTDEYGKKWPY